LPAGRDLDHIPLLGEERVVRYHRYRHDHRHILEVELIEQLWSLVE
jgi:hypothetical protein